MMPDGASLLSPHHTSQIQAAWENAREHTQALSKADEERATLLARIETLKVEASVAREDGAHERQQLQHAHRQAMVEAEQAASTAVASSSSNEEAVSALREEIERVREEKAAIEREAEHLSEEHSVLRTMNDVYAEQIKTLEHPNDHLVSIGGGRNVCLAR